MYSAFNNVAAPSRSSAAAVIAAIDQHIADAGFAQFAEGHFCG
jgi:hypothetical protein